MYSSAAIANYFLAKSWTEGESVDPLKLQKLLYYAHGWHLAVEGSPLLKEAVEAWKWGPVVSSIYHEFKGFGSRPIDRPASDYRQDTEGNWRIYIPRLTPGEIEESGQFLDQIWDIYRDWSGVEMADASHAKGSPWRKVREGKAETIIDNKHISDDLIQSHFEEKLKKYREG